MKMNGAGIAEVSEKGTGGKSALDDFHAALNQASDQTSASRKSLKDTEQQLKEVNEQ